MTIGLFLTALALGLRHGVDWDHIAAISDLSGTAPDRRRGFALSMTYAIGHAAVVFVLGTLAILFGLAIPDGLDVWMGRIVGLTLIVLGGWILFELTRRGRDFRLRSRWMLVIDGTFAGLRRVRNGLTGRSIAIEHDHDHDHDDHRALNHTVIDLTDSRSVHDHAHVGSTDAMVNTSMGAEPVAATTGSKTASGSSTGWRSWRERTSHKHSHPHSHELLLPDTPEANYGHGTATGIGMLHGVGIESPTQIAIFVAASAVTGVGFGLVLLGAWVLGLIVANAVLALIASAGLLSAERSFPVYATLAVVISILSITLGTVYLFDLDLLPALS